jgi:hypothetical protein
LEVTIFLPKTASRSASELVKSAKLFRHNEPKAAVLLASVRKIEVDCV